MAMHVTYLTNPRKNRYISGVETWGLSAVLENCGSNYPGAAVL